jgi:hypothetical protein
MAFLLRVAAAWKLHLPHGRTEELVPVLTQGLECCLLDMLPPSAGLKGPLDKENGFFVSHRWASPFLDTVQLLMDYFDVRSPDDPKAPTTIVWMVRSP